MRAIVSTIVFAVHVKMPLDARERSPAPPIIGIQRYHASNFIKTLRDPQPLVWGPIADVQFPRL